MSDALRRFLLAIFLLGVAGMSGELWLMGHYEDFYQQIPLALFGLSLAALSGVLLRPGPATVNLFRAAMAFFILSGVIGAILHFQVNLEFQLEMDPSLQGVNLYRKAILAKTPPALAPGAMIQLGLIGLAYTFRGLTPPTDQRRGLTPMEHP
jgi:hypothetical protein